MTSFKQISLEELSTHSKPEDAWLAIDNLVYDVTKFLPLHPAGKNIIKPYLGTECSQIFNYFHSTQIKDKYKNLVIGTLEKPKTKKPSPLA